MSARGTSEAPPVEPILARAERCEIDALQLERLRSSLHHAYANNPCYRASFDAQGVRPEDLKSLADLARFPFTTKADLRAAYPFGFFAVPMDRVARLHASSGTTGKPTVVGYTRQDIDTWSNLVARSIRAAGGRRGMRVHVAYGYGLFTGGLGAHYGAEAAGCTVIPMSGGQTERQVQLIMDFRPDIIMITPSYMLAVLDEFKRRRIDPRSERPRHRHLRRGALGGGHPAGNRIPVRHRCLRHLRAVRSDGAGRGTGIRTHQGRPHHLGRPLPARDRRSAKRRAGRALASRGSSCSPR